MNTYWKLLIWLVAGILLTFAAFYLIGGKNDHWTSLNAAGLVTIVFIFILLGFTLRSPFTMKTRVSTWIIAILVIVVGALGWRGMENLSKYQRRTLMEIHGVIIKGIIQSEIYTPFQKVLREYYGQTGKKKETIGQVFQRLFPLGKVGENIHDVHVVSPDSDDSLRVVVTALSDNEIAVTGFHCYSPGKKKEFKNYNGRYGRVQAKGVLTEKGVRYESEN
jgi:hypothetical protein